MYGYEGGCGNEIYGDWERWWGQHGARGGEKIARSSEKGKNTVLDKYILTWRNTWRFLRKCILEIQQRERA